MTEIKINDVKSLAKALVEFSKSESEENGVCIVSVIDMISIYLDLDSIDTYSDEDFEEFDNYVIERMKVFECNSSNPYYDFYTYLTDIEKFSYFCSLVGRKISENWDAISKVLHEELDLKNFYEDDMRYIVQEIHRKKAEIFSITCIDCFSLFNGDVISTDSSPLEEIYCEYVNIYGKDEE